MQEADAQTKACLHDQWWGPKCEQLMGIQGLPRRMPGLPKFAAGLTLPHVLIVGFRLADFAASDAAGGRICGATVWGARLSG